jgi:hypothetical protein
MGAVMNPENHLQSHVSLPATSGEIGSFTITDLHTYTHTHTYCESVRGEGDHIYTRTHSHTRSTHTQYICARRRISQTHTHTHTHTHTVRLCAELRKSRYALKHAGHLCPIRGDDRQRGYTDIHTHTQVRMHERPRLAFDFLHELQSGRIGILEFPPNSTVLFEAIVVELSPSTNA